MARHIVVKLGTQLLTDSAGRLDARFLSSIATQVARLRSSGTLVTIVSSGAIGAGVAELNLSRRPTDLAKLQAVAAIGQRRLMDTWASAFVEHLLPVAQLLLTRDDVDARSRFLNLRNTIHAVHELGGVPIINENDSVSTDELVKITFGDNDLLAATVAVALRADVLVLLTNVEGLLDENGATVAKIEDLDAAQQLVRLAKSPSGKGGMQSKLAAARMVTDAGHDFVVAGGRTLDVLIRLMHGESIGTRVGSRASSSRGDRTRWLSAARPAGTIIVDTGCAQAIVERQKSLLPAGIVRIEGDFASGDVVDIVDSDARLLARGLTNYSAADLMLIRGKKSAEVRQLIPNRAYDEVVHRDNLAVLLT